jgi:hypothetical protein
MVLDLPLGITEDSLQDLNPPFNPYRQIYLLANLPYDGLFQGLSQLYPSAWDAPFPVARLPSTPGQQDLFTPYDDRPHPDDGTIRVLPLHTGSPLMLGWAHNLSILKNTGRAPSLQQE